MFPQKKKESKRKTINLMAHSTDLHFMHTTTLHLAVKEVQNTFSETLVHGHNVQQHGHTSTFEHDKQF